MSPGNRYQMRGSTRERQAWEAWCIVLRTSTPVDTTGVMAELTSAGVTVNLA